MTEDTTTDTSESATGVPTGLGDTPLAECDHERFERNHYFHGKLMTARDMAAEQAYHAGQRRAHARSVAGRGVAWGLDASVSEDGDDAIAVAVDTGYAIDACGRAIVVPSTRETTVTDPEVVAAETVTVELVYEDCLKESVPISGAESACESECAYNRVLEAYRIEVSPGTPTGPAKSVPTVTFPDPGEYDRPGRGQPAIDDPALTDAAESYRSSTHATTGEPGSGRVFVGAFEAPTDGGDDADWQDLEAAYPAPYVYTNDMLYAAIARHAADFENPHEVTLSTSTPDEGDGVQVRVRDDGRDDPDVAVRSGDGSVDVGLPAEREIDLSVESYVEEIVERRIDPLERYAVERALQYTALVFRHAGDRFDEDANRAAETARTISQLARGATDGRLSTDSDADAAENLPILDANWTETRRKRGDVYEQLAEEIAGLATQFADQIQETVTEPSYRRLDVAIERLQTTVGAEDRPGDPLPVAGAQDDLADAVEWLEPREDEEEEPEETVDASFTSTTYATHRGDVAEFSVDVGDADAATITVGGEEMGYETTLEVEPASGSESTILVNTYLAGRIDDEARAWASADGDDSLGVTRESDAIDSLLAAGTYELGLSVDDTQTGVAVLSLLSRSTDGLAVLGGAGAPAYGSLDTADAIEEARNAGDLQATDTVEPGQPLVLAVSVTGVFGAIAAETGDPITPTVGGFESLLDGEQFRLRVGQLVEEGRGKAFSVPETVEAGDARYVLDPGAGQLYLVVDTGAAVVRLPGMTSIGEDVGFAYGETYRAQFVVDAASRLADDDEQVAAEFSTGRPPTVAVPEVVGRPEDDAVSRLSGEGFATSVETVEVSNPVQLDRGYGNVLSQSPEAGSEAIEGSEVGLTVLVSRPVTVLSGIAEARSEQLAAGGVEWVHELAEANVQTLAGATDFRSKQLANWKARAQEFLTGLHASLRFQVDYETTREVSEALAEYDHQEILEVEESVVESQLATATDEEVIDPTAAQQFLASGTELQYEETMFETNMDDVILNDDVVTDFDVQ